MSDVAPRLLVVNDLDRLGPIARDFFAPNPIAGVRNFIAGIAEIPRAPTRAVLVGHDVQCRNPEAAVAAIKSVAGDIPVVYCCEPAYENVGRRVVEHGADAYVIFPPEAIDLEQALKIPSRMARPRSVVKTETVPLPSAEELSGLATILAQLSNRDPETLDAVAALICTAVGATAAVVTLEGRVGRSGDMGSDQAANVVIENIVHNEQRIGQIRVVTTSPLGFAPEYRVKLNHYGVLLGRLFEAADVTERWRTLALTDDLTSLPNRRHLTRFLEDKLAWAERNRSIVTVLLFDIDDFKRYNDTYGHDAGDEILREVGQLFLKCSRQTDMVARLGGDEFVVVFWDPEGPRIPGSQHPGAVLDVLQRFQRTLKGHTFSRLGAEAKGCLTISGGLAHYPWQANNPSDLLEAADKALMQAKLAGKNRFWIVGRGEVADGKPIVG